MAYTLPSKGQRDWDDELNNSLEYLRGVAEAAKAAADNATSTANTARSRLDGMQGDTASKVVDALNNEQTVKDALSASIAQLAVWARNPDLLIAGAVTRDANGAATSAPVKWPDGTVGTYTADAVSTAFPGAVDAYHVTYGSPVTKTFTQPAITRDATTGAATNVPAITVA